MTLSAISKHLKVLERAGLIQSRRDAQRRSSRFQAQTLREVTDSLEQCRQFWKEHLNLIGGDVHDLQLRHWDSVKYIETVDSKS